MSEIRYVQPGTLEELLVKAARAHDIARVREILARGPDSKARLPSGYPIIFGAGTDQIKTLMFESGADVNAKAAGGTTLLHIHACDDDTDAIVWLLRCGADVNAREDDGRTTLFNTVHAKCPAAVELLLAHGANVNTRDVDDRTALHSAVFNCNRIIVETLLRNGADVNAPDNRKLDVRLVRRMAQQDQARHPRFEDE